MKNHSQIEDVFEQIVNKELLAAAKAQQKYLYYIVSATLGIHIFLGTWSGLQNNTTFYIVACLFLLISIFFWKLRNQDYAPIVFYYLCSNTLITSGILFTQYTKLNLPEMMMILAASGLIVLHLFVLVATRHIIIQTIIGLIIFAISLQNHFDDAKNFYHSFLILGSLLVAAFTAIQRYRMTYREIVAQTIIYHSNQKLHQQQQEIIEQNKKIIEKERNLRAIIDNSNMAIWLLDTKCNLIEFNNKFSQYIWHSYQEKVSYGDNFIEKISRIPNGQIWKQRFDDALKGKTQVYIDYYPEFGGRYIQTEFFPIVIDREIMGISVFGKNITKQKIAENTIQYNQKLLSSISRNIQEAIYRSTPTEGLIYANDAFTKLFGYDESELFSVSLTDFYADAHKREEILERLLRGEAINNEEVLLRKKDGTLFWALMSVIAHTDEDKVYFDGAIRDITHVKEIQNQLETQNEELKKINSELDRFVYSASHDLKAPLASVLGLIHIAKMEEDKDTIIKYMEMMEQSILKLDNFIKDIIDYSRNARLEATYEEINIENLVQNIFDNLSYLEKSKNIQKRIFVEQDSPCYTDAKRLSIILNNLLSNAINYHNILQKEPFVEVNTRIDHKHIKISVKDNGLGIAHEHIGRIFDMFYRASYDSKGSGLGLYIVKEAINKLNGQISVHSELGKGTKFDILLPNHIPNFSQKPLQEQESDEVSVES
jgi:PAS domain S-box-containing protein